jgi:dihydrolipoamide dehydrogenase
VCAIRLAQLGRKVTVIDRAEVGGVCLNRGCIPSKALIHAGTFYEKLSHAGEMGIEVKGAKLDLPKLMSWKEGVVKKLTGGVGQLLKANGCQVLSGEATFTGPKSLELMTAEGKQTITFQQAVIATGSRPAALPGFTIDQKRILDSTGALALTTQPKSLLCIGGGYIGLELGTFYSKVGTEVTVVEAGAQLLGGVDPDLTKIVAKRLEKRGVKVLTQTSIQGAQVTPKGVSVKLSQGGKASTLEVDAVLVTIGRTPNTDRLGLEKAGGRTDSQRAR